MAGVRARVLFLEQDSLYISVVSLLSSNGICWSDFLDRGGVQMGFVGVHKGSSVNRTRGVKQVLKAYYSPHVTKLTREEALARLRSKALVGEASARQFLRIATELMERQK
jgi:hypothetical protein